MTSGVRRHRDSDQAMAVVTRMSSWITKDVLERHLAPPGEDSLTLVCGLPRVYETLCGPRGDPKVAGTLAALGWSRRDVVKL